jgi:hypothetical protein
MHFPFSASDGSGSDSDMDIGSEAVERRDGVRRAAAAKAVAKFADSDRLNHYLGPPDKIL